MSVRFSSDSISVASSSSSSSFPSDDLEEPSISDKITTVSLRRLSFSGDDADPIPLTERASELSSAGSLSPRNAETSERKKTRRVRQKDYYSLRKVTSQFRAEEMTTPITDADLPLLNRAIQGSDEMNFSPETIANEIQVASRRPGPALFLLFYKLLNKSEAKWFAVAKHLFLYAEGGSFLRSYFGIYGENVDECASKLMLALKEDEVDHQEVLASLTMMSQGCVEGVSAVFCREYLRAMLKEQLQELRGQLRKISLKEKDLPVTEALELIYGIVIPEECRELLSMRREYANKGAWEKSIGKLLLLEAVALQALSSRKCSKRRGRFFKAIKNELLRLIEASSTDRLQEIHRDFINRSSSCQPCVDVLEDQEKGFRFLSALRSMQEYFSSHFEKTSVSSSVPEIKQVPLASPRSITPNPLYRHLRMSFLFSLGDSSVPYNHVATVTEFISNLKCGLGAEQLLVKHLHLMKKKSNGDPELVFREALFFSGLMVHPQGSAFLVRLFKFSQDANAYDIDAFVQMAVSFYLDSDVSPETIDDMLKSATLKELEKKNKDEMFRGVNLSSLLMREFGTHYWKEQLTGYLDFVEKERGEIFTGDGKDEAQMDLFLRSCIEELHRMTLPDRLRHIFRLKGLVVRDCLDTQTVEQFAGIELILRVLNPALVKRSQSSHAIQLSKMLQRLANQIPFNGGEYETHLEIKKAIYDEFVGKHQEFINKNLSLEEDDSQAASSSESTIILSPQPAK